VVAIKSRAKELGLRKASPIIKIKTCKKPKEVAAAKPKPKFKSYYQPISIEAVWHSYGIRV